MTADHPIQSNKAKYQSYISMQSMWINHAWDLLILHSDGDLQSSSQVGQHIYQQILAVCCIAPPIRRLIVAGTHHMLKEINWHGQPTWL